MQKIGPAFGHGTIEGSFVHHKQESCNVVRRFGGCVDFADVKARSPIEQAAALVGLACTEERLQFRVPCPASNNCGPSGVVTGYIGITAKAVLPFQRGHLPKELPGTTPRRCGVFSILAAAVHGCPIYR